MELIVEGSREDRAYAVFPLAVVPGVSLLIVPEELSSTLVTKIGIVRVAGPVNVGHISVPVEGVGNRVTRGVTWQPDRSSPIVDANEGLSVA
jgi:hypothetical protein